MVSQKEKKVRVALAALIVKVKTSKEPHHPDSLSHSNLVRLINKTKLYSGHPLSQQSIKDVMKGAKPLNLGLLPAFKRVLRADRGVSIHDSDFSPIEGFCLLWEEDIDINCLGIVSHKIANDKKALIIELLGTVKEQADRDILSTPYLSELVKLGEREGLIIPLVEELSKFFLLTNDVKEKDELYTRLIDLTPQNINLAGDSVSQIVTMFAQEDAESLIKSYFRFRHTIFSTTPSFTEIEKALLPYLLDKIESDEPQIIELSILFLHCIILPSNPLITSQVELSDHLINSLYQKLISNSYVTPYASRSLSIILGAIYCNTPVQDHIYQFSLVADGVLKRHRVLKPEVTLSSEQLMWIAPVIEKFNFSDDGSTRYGLAVFLRRFGIKNQHFNELFYKRIKEEENHQNISLIVDELLVYLAYDNPEFNQDYLLDILGSDSDKYSASFEHRAFLCLIGTADLHTLIRMFELSKYNDLINTEAVCCSIQSGFKGGISGLVMRTKWWRQKSTRKLIFKYIIQDYKYVYAYTKEWLMSVITLPKK